jgi:putative restriction endonuclease
MGECLWSPRENQIGRSWAFWETMKSVQPGDVVFHLCGRWPKTVFTGFSTASSPCIWLEEGPDGAAPLYRVELANFKALDAPLLLKAVFEAHEEELRKYFGQNDSKADKERLFYVIQSGRLQCLNGAYLSYLSDTLLSLIFGVQRSTTPNKSESVAPSTGTGSALTEAARRLGHYGFSQNVRKNFSYRCCFPGCSVNDARFLVGAHIARWADHPHLRGETSNGLCLCLHHDKAFEIGVFTFDHLHRVVLRLDASSPSWLSSLLSSHAGDEIGPCQISP